ncbi:MAG: hypothetical protein Q9194_005794 [Teloschistes cf. exilis]
MSLFGGNTIKLPASSDFHVHLRDGPMMDLVTPSVRSGGVNTCYVMPNTIPPITTPKQAIDYRSKLQALAPDIHFLVTLYLHESMTVDTITEAKKAGIAGVKSYPAGVTTNSSSGVVDYTSFFPIFAQMEKEDMVLNLHGECPSQGDITILNAESKFLPILASLASRFPKLRICLEHLTTAAAVEAVEKLGKNVVGTITCHHLYLVVDDWAGNSINYCKPVAKTVADRNALLRAVASGNPKFFFGSDSAPHPVASKRGGGKVAAGVFSQPYTTQLVVGALERAVEMEVLKREDVTLDKLEGFMSRHGRDFYKLPPTIEIIELTKGDEKILDIVGNEDKTLQVIPFRAGEPTWSLNWTG